MEQDPPRLYDLESDPHGYLSPLNRCGGGVMVTAYDPKTEFGKKHMNRAAEIRQAAQDDHRTREIHAAIFNCKKTGETRLLVAANVEIRDGKFYADGQEIQL